MGDTIVYVAQESLVSDFKSALHIQRFERAGAATKQGHAQLIKI